MSRELFEHVETVLVEDGFELVEVSRDGDDLIAVLDREASVVVTVLVEEGHDGVRCMTVRSVAGTNIELDDESEHFGLLRLLNKLNSNTTIGKWLFRPETGSIYVEHSMPLKGLGIDELTTVVRSIEVLADEHDEDLVELVGSGETMRDALIKAARFEEADTDH